MTELELGKQLYILFHDLDIFHNKQRLHSVIPHLLPFSFSCSLFFMLHCSHLYICLHIYIYYCLGSACEREHVIFFFLRLCDLVNIVHSNLCIDAIFI